VQPAKMVLHICFNWFGVAIQCVDVVQNTKIRSETNSSTHFEMIYTNNIYTVNLRLQIFNRLGKVNKYQ